MHKIMMEEVQNKFFLIKYLIFIINIIFKEQLKKQLETADKKIIYLNSEVEKLKRTNLLKTESDRFLFF